MRAQAEIPEILLKSSNFYKKSCFLCLFFFSFKSLIFLSVCSSQGNALAPEPPPTPTLNRSLSPLTHTRTHAHTHAHSASECALCDMNT